MSSISKRLSLRVPANVIYRGLKDTRLERLFPEFFTGVTRRLTDSNKANSELQFTTDIPNAIISIQFVHYLANTKASVKLLRVNCHWKSYRFHAFPDLNDT